MKVVKIVRIVCCFCLLLVGILTVFSAVPILAALPLTEGEERISLDAKYPSVEVSPGESSEFEVTLSYATYSGEGEDRVFELVTTAPKNWAVYLTDKYKKDVKITAITLDPASTTLEVVVRVVVTPPFWYMPEPGEYVITLETIGTTQAGGELKGSIELKAIIPATYVLDLVPTTERYSIPATAGRDTLLSLEIQNNGSAAIDDITFSSDEPEGWTVEFSPDKVDSLTADSSQEIEVTIKPPRRTIAGDYYVLVKAEGTQVSAERLDIRVTIEAPAIWEWVGVGIILVVIAGIVFIFMRFSHR